MGVMERNSLYPSFSSITSYDSYLNTIKQERLLGSSQCNNNKLCYVAERNILTSTSKCCQFVSLQ